MNLLTTTNLAHAQAFDAEMAEYAGISGTTNAVAEWLPNVAGTLYWARENDYVRNAGLGLVQVNAAIATIGVLSVKDWQTTMQRTTSNDLIADGYISEEE